VVVKRVKSALLSTRVHAGFFVQQTADFKGSVEFLTRMHHVVAALFARSAQCQRAPLLQPGRPGAGGGGGGGPAPHRPSTSAYSRGSAGGGGGAAAKSALLHAATDSFDYLDDGLTGSQAAFAGVAAAIGHSMAAATAAAGSALWLIGGGQAADATSGGGGSSAPAAAAAGAAGHTIDLTDDDSDDDEPRGGGGGGGSSSRGGGARAASTAAAAVSSSSSSGSAGGLAHLCRFDRCNLWGRSGLPRWVRSYSEFKLAAAKARAFTASQLFGRMLRQVNGFSEKRAQALLALHPTPSSLAGAYDAAGARGLSRREREALFKALPVRQLNGQLGASLSEALHAAFDSRGAAPAAAVAAGGRPAAGFDDDWDVGEET